MEGWTDNQKNERLALMHKSKSWKPFALGIWILPACNCVILSYETFANDAEHILYQFFGANNTEKKGKEKNKKEVRTAEDHVPLGPSVDGDPRRLACGDAYVGELSADDFHEVVANLEAPLVSNQGGHLSKAIQKNTTKINRTKIWSLDLSTKNTRTPFRNKFEKEVQFRLRFPNFPAGHMKCFNQWSRSMWILAGDETSSPCIREMKSWQDLTRPFGSILVYWARRCISWKSLLEKFGEKVCVNQVPTSQ